MEDYLVFGLGHEGDIKNDEAGLDKISVVTKAVMRSTNSNEPVVYPMTQFKEFNVVRQQAYDGEFYNIAFDVLPSRDRVDAAIRKYHPKKSSTV
ncbi:hypothetical protein ACOTXO_22275 [Enterobacter cloacae complex sp. CDL006]|nr:MULTISPECIES: hypothetical protein [Enterobacter]HDP6486238.1 hypothetical protein [Escherichia coli]EHE7804046.1 hypothetical protein [Enterobacter hormaechei]EIY1158236.1 hypothetical protein [Enterobacter hormaechei]EKL0728602.1 hypothetical protein [Enterobacter hormaechei]EKS6630908.1 hypothetical protein [Enterobacter hormaechei]